MLNSFLVKNFRLFQELRIQGFRRVNLVVGRNNSGKSALLEAIELYASNASVQVLIGLITKRQETWINLVEAPNLNPLRHLFFGHQLPELDACGITVGPIQPEDMQIKLQIGAYRLQEEEGTLRRVPITQLSELEDFPNSELSLVAVEDNKIRRVLGLDHNPVEVARNYQKTAKWLSNEPKFTTQVVPTDTMTEEKLAALWDAINLTGLDEEVIAGLQLIEPNIVGIAFVKEAVFLDNRLPIVKMRHIAEPLPLRSLGDGMLRLFQITVALVNARNGILLIDEFENGLHWSVQPKAWGMVFRLAEKLNVQVFASTHSRDCISGFESAWQQQEALGAFFRLNSSANRPTTVTMYTCETLSDALETDVEVR